VFAKGACGYPPFTGRESLCGSAKWCGGGISCFPFGGLGRRSGGGSPGLPLNGGRGDSVNEGVASCLGGYAEGAGRIDEESACFSLSMKEREGPAPKGDGNDVFEGWDEAEGGGGYGFVPEMTSEIDGSDCRFMGSISSFLRAGSAVEAVPLEAD
jgi:hypothetical protein